MGNRSSSVNAFKPSRPKVTLSKKKKKKKYWKNKKEPLVIQEEEHSDPEDVQADQDNHYCQIESRKTTQTSYTEEIQLRWKPPAKCKRKKQPGGSGSLVAPGGSITGYRVEMWDLTGADWITVVETNQAKCKLSNILSGVLYQFRVIAMTSNGPAGYPSEPCEPFIVNIPNVSIAPYWVHPLNCSTVAYEGETLTLHVKALGTPKPSVQWLSDGENIFISEGVYINNDDLGSELVIDGDRVSQFSFIECVAINDIGKCETTTELIFPPKFRLGSKTNPHRVQFKERDLVRFRLPLFSRPDPGFEVRKPEQDSSNPHLRFKEDHLIFQLDSAKKSDSGFWSVVATNEVGSDMVMLELLLKLPLARPNRPEIQVSDFDHSVALSWTMPADFVCHNPKFLVEYFRDRWQIWLNGKTCHEPSCILTDLVPNSRYKFRVKLVTDTEQSEPSEETEVVYVANNNHLASRPGKGIRQSSLDREVYYGGGDSNQRQDVVTYDAGVPPAVLNKKLLGRTVVSKYRMSGQDEDLYRKSLTNLCNMINKVSRSRSGTPNSSTESLRQKTTLASSPSSQGDQRKPPTSLATSNRRKQLTRQAYSLDSPGHPLPMNPAIEDSKIGLGGQGLTGSKRKTESTMSLHDASKLVNGSVSRIASMQSLLRTDSNPCFFRSMQLINNRL